MCHKELNTLRDVHLLEARQFVENEEISKVFVRIEVVIQCLQCMALLNRLLWSKIFSFDAVALGWIKCILFVKAGADFFDLVASELAHRHSLILLQSQNGEEL